MLTITTIVEGDGEVSAVPVLLRRLAMWLTPQTQIKVTTPIRVRRDRFIRRDDDFQKYVQLAAAKAGKTGWTLILLGADDDCPVELAPQIAQRAQRIVGHERVAVVLPMREFEAWFVASAWSLDGKRGLKVDTVPKNPEIARNAKGWLHARMSNGYREVTDQPAFAAGFDLVQAREKSRSFKKLCDEWLRQVRSAERNHREAN